jgi:hypothetical protein
MAVREFWEIKWIQWINVQEDWVTKVSIADTVNIVWLWSVTDVWWVATINIPEWVTWYREDVTAGSATYTFVNAPATATSFLVFTDSGTLMFAGIDYTYDPDTETITFISLWANEKAYIWVAHATVEWGGIWDMVKAVYDPTNINRSAFDYNNFINTPTIWDAALTIQKNGTTINTFTANATSPVNVDIEVPTTVAELDDWWDYVIWAASSTDWNIVVFDWATWKIIKDSWLNIQVSNSPTWDMCNVYYDNGTIYLQVVTQDYLWLEDWDAILTEAWDKLVVEN